MNIKYIHILIKWKSLVSFQLDLFNWIKLSIHHPAIKYALVIYNSVLWCWKSLTGNISLAFQFCYSPYRGIYRLMHVNVSLLINNSSLNLLKGITVMIIRTHGKLLDFDIKTDRINNKFYVFFFQIRSCPNSSRK